MNRYQQTTTKMEWTTSIDPTHQKCSAYSQFITYSLDQNIELITYKSI